MTKFKPRGPTRFKHQREGLRDVIRNRGVHALLFEPGLGKTATVIDYASLLALKSPTNHTRVLVLAPLAAIDSWVSQTAIFAARGVSVHAEALGGSIAQRAETLKARGDNRYMIGAQRSLAVEQRKEPDDHCFLTLLAMNFDSFASRATAKGSHVKNNADLMIEAVKAFAPDLIVADESHRLKGATSNTSKAIARLTDVCKRRILLTGTVMPHSPLDVFGQWRFLEPTAFGRVQTDGSRRKATYGQFRAEFAQMGGWMGKEVRGFKNLDRMQDTMALNASTATKLDALDLPPITDVIVPVDLTKAEKRAYGDMTSDLVTQMDSGALASVPNRLSQLMRLRQITSGYLPTNDGGIEELGESKIKTIKSLVHDTLVGERRIVVFSHFRHEIAMLEQRLAQPGTDVAVITGSTTNKERLAIRKRFGSDDPARIVLVAQTRTMSLAVNELVTASHAIFGSLPERRDDITQARARLDRQGQKRPVTIWTMIALKTVDEVLLKSYRERTNLEAEMVKHVRDLNNQGEHA